MRSCDRSLWRSLCSNCSVANNSHTNTTATTASCSSHSVNNSHHRQNPTASNTSHNHINCHNNSNNVSLSSPNILTNSPDPSLDTSSHNLSYPASSQPSLLNIWPGELSGKYQKDLSCFPDQYSRLDSGLSSSSPCLLSEKSSSSSSHCSAPIPPPRRSESFQCVALHIQIRAKKAELAYFQLLRQTLVRSQELATKFENMAESGALNVDENSHNDENHVINRETPPPPDSISSANEELQTPTFTPPSPLSSLESVPSTSASQQKPMFIYSYNPPNFDIDYIDSEYDSHTAYISDYDSHSNSHYHSLSSTESNEKSAQYFSLSESKSVQQGGAVTEDVLSPSKTEDNVTSSTQSATLLLTQDSDVSPLPPHKSRVSPMHTDTHTTPSTVSLGVSDQSIACTEATSAFSNYTETTPTYTDFSSISPGNFTRKSEERSPSSFLSPESCDLDTLGGHTPSTICVSPLSSSEKNVCFNSKTSDEQSQQTLSLSDSQKKSQEGVSDPTNTTSSERARRSSPYSSPDQSLSSLPSDTITMNAAIESIGTDTDPSTGSGHNMLPRDLESRQSQDETDPATDSAFASPSTSPTLSKSQTITPIPIRGQELQPTASGSEVGAYTEATSSGICNISNYVDADTSQSEDVDDTAESESIYPESECDIRLASSSRDDTDGYQRDSSPERTAMSAVAKICELENAVKTVENSNNLQPVKATREAQHKITNEISSSGNSSMSNSPALSTDIAMTQKNTLSQKDTNKLVVNNNLKNNDSDSHVTNWLCNGNQENYIVTPPIDQEDTADINGNFIGSVEDSTRTITIEEISSDSQSYISTEYVPPRSFPYFGPLPTIHEVVDTPPDPTPSSDVVTNNVDATNDINSNISRYMPVISSSVHSSSSLSEKVTSSDDASFMSNPRIPPPPPPRIRETALKTPPLPPPPSDDDNVNPLPIPTPPSEHDCLPPLPPLPIAPFLLESPPPIPPHNEIPTPPKRMYLLIPLHTQRGPTPKRNLSPPPAPPRSTSLKRSPPPPPPRSARNTPSLEYRRANECHDATTDNGHTDMEEDDTRSMSSPSDVSSVICVSKLTPVPEEKSNNSSPLPPALLVASSENLDKITSSDCLLKNNSFQSVCTIQVEPPPTLLLTQTKDHTQDKCSNNFFNSSASCSSEQPLSPPPPPPPKARISLTPPVPPPKISKNFRVADELTKPSIVALHNSPLDKKMESLDTIKPVTSHRESSIPQPPAVPPQPKPIVSKSSQNDSLRAEQPPEAPPAQPSPLLSVSNYGKLVVDRTDLALLSPEEEVGRVYSSGHRWGWLRDGLDTVALYTQLRPVIQHGPQCGLVALSMASQLSGASSASNSRRGSLTTTTPSSPQTTSPQTTGVSAAELLEAAQTAGYSTHGEMFSAECLASLANQKLGDTMHATVRRDVLADKHLFLELMLSGALILVPYDAQHNHQPGRYRGHKAHWGVVSGAIVQSTYFSKGPTSAAAFARPDSRYDFLWHVRRGYHGGSSGSRSGSRTPSRTTAGVDRRDRSASPGLTNRERSAERFARSVTPSRGTNAAGGSMNQAALSAFSHIPAEELFVIAMWRQGKSRLLTSSTLEELRASNAQLVEYPPSPSEAGFERDFIVGDVEEGLANQVVVITKTTQAVTALSELLDRLNN